MSWLRDRMPLDGRGWAWPNDERRLLFKTLAGSVGRRLPAPAAGLVLAAARVGWLPYAFAEAWRLSRQPERRARLGPLFLDCLMAGARGREAWIWRELFGERIEFGNRASSTLLALLGEPAGHALLVDKVAAAQALRAGGAPVPETLAVIGPGSTEEDLRPIRSAGIGLVIKLQEGFGAYGLIMADPLGPDRWRMNGVVSSWEDFSARLRAAGAPMLAQPRLYGARALTGFLEAERPPVLRITTARRPGGAPFFHCAYLSIPVPGNSPNDYLRKDIRALVDPVNGRLDAAVLFAAPWESLAVAPWNGAKIEGRVLEGVPAAVQATLTAAAAIPPVPVISWDVVPTDAGPMILEGNSMGSWLLANFGRRGRNAASLLPVLAEWATVAGAQSRA
jgi:hypothetical protein